MIVFGQLNLGVFARWRFRTQEWEHGDNSTALENGVASVAFAHTDDVTAESTNLVH